MKIACAIAMLMGVMMTFSTASYAARARGDQERTPAQLRAYNHYMQGVAHSVAGESTAAVDEFRKALRSSPGHAAAYYQIALILSQNNRMDMATEYARRAYLGDSTNRDYTGTYARYLAMTGEYVAAERHFRRLVQEDSTDLERQSMLALLLYQLEEPEQALELIDRIESRGGIQSSLVEIKRQALLSAERYSDAYQYMTMACEAYPDETKFQILTAEIAATLRQDSLAVSIYNRAIEMAPAALIPRISLAQYYRIKGMNSMYFETLVPAFQDTTFLTVDKINYFKAYIDQYIDTPEEYRANIRYVSMLASALFVADSSSYDAMDFYAGHLMHVGSYDKAHLMLCKALSAPNAAVVDTYRRIISLARFRQQNDTIDHYMSLAETRFPRNDELAMTRVYVEMQRGDTLAAQATAKRVISTTKNDSIAALALSFCGDISQRRGDIATTLKYYSKALKRKPDDVMLLNNYAYYLSTERKSLPRALEMSQLSNEMAPQNPTYLDTKAWILYQLGRYEEAQTVMRQALALMDPVSSEMLMHYGDILQALGQTFMAESYWKRALEAGAPADEIKQRLDSLKTK